jgi:teichuronic acid biosynthesis glycosyltransferase TuaH
VSEEFPGDWSDLVVMCAVNFWHGVRYQDRHIAEQLAPDRPVLYVDPPLSALTARKRPEYGEALHGPRLRCVAPRIARLTVVAAPGPTRPGMVGITSALVRRQIAKAVRTLDGTVDALITTSAFLDVFGSSEARLRVFWAQDDLAGGAELLGADADRIRRGEARLAADSDTIIAANPVVAQTWIDRGYTPHLIPFGCDPESYADVDACASPADVTLEGPIVGFVGLIGSRIDFDLLEAIADRGRSLLLVGPRHWLFEIDRVERLLARPNVCWVGGKEFEELPPYLKMIDVGIVPYNDSAFNRGSFPLKTLEYLSAGRAAVATDLPAIRWLATDLISVANTPQAFADAVDAELAKPRTPEIVERRQAFAREHSWHNRAMQFAAIIDAARTGGRFA